MESTEERVVKVRKERTSTKSRKTSNVTQNQKRQNMLKITTQTAQQARKPRGRTKANRKQEIILPFRETSQESGKAFTAMNWTSSGRQTDLSFVDENAQDSILRNNEPDSIKTDERDLQSQKE
jgi:hypothetical protein